MSIEAQTLRKLAGLHLDADQLAGVIEILADVQAAEEARKLAQRERSRKSRASRDRNVTATAETRDMPRAGVTRVEDKTLTSEIEPQVKLEQKETRVRASHEFDTWYRAYPHKVQRGAAEKAFPAARQIASLDQLIAGVQRYVASKPADRAYQNPATWLRGKGWLDEPATVHPHQARAGPGKPTPMDHFRDYARELNGQAANDRGDGGNWDDAPGVPVLAIEHLSR